MYAKNISLDGRLAVSGRAWTFSGPSGTRFSRGTPCGNPCSRLLASGSGPSGSIPSGDGAVQERIPIGTGDRRPVLPTRFIRGRLAQLVEACGSEPQGSEFESPAGYSAPIVDGRSRRPVET